MKYTLRNDEDDCWYLVPLDKLDEFSHWAWVEDGRGWPNLSALPKGVTPLGEDLSRLSFDHFQWRGYP